MSGTTFISYNSTGFALNKQDFIRDILTQKACDIIFVQETFLGENNQTIINNIHDDFIGTGKCGTDLTLDICKGRNKGGLAIIWRKSVGNNIKQIPCESKRLMAMSLQCNMGSVLLINTYFPVDSHNKTYINPELTEVCDELERLLHACKQQFVIIGGDLNIDFKRNNIHTTYVKDMLERNKLVSVWQHTSFPEYTYSGPTGKSCIDHFVVSENVKNVTDWAIVEYGGLNCSVHSPIIMKVKFDITKNNITCLNHNPNDRIAWHKVSEHDKLSYQVSLENKLNDIYVPNDCSCEGTHCKNVSHRDDIDILCESIIKTCIDASDVFPKTKKKKKFPYWGSKIKPFKDDAIFWSNIWIQCGKPSNGVVHGLMKKTKLQYHYAIRKLKRESDKLRKCRMAESIAGNNSRNFWDEVKKVNGNGAVYPTSVEGKTDSYDIASLFAEKYSKLYNSVPSDPARLMRVKQDIEKRLNVTSLLEMKINDIDVNKAIRSIQNNKADGDGKFFSNHLIYAPPIILRYLSTLFNAMIVHGYTPKCLLKSSIISIPKNARGDLTSGDNYRGIALCSSMFKLYELLLIQKQQHNLKTSDMQFAYKCSHSTTMSTLVLKEVVNHFLLNGSNVYCCFIDASKAFDRLRHDKLFELLLQKNVNPYMLKSIMESYERQTIDTSWLGKKSFSFTCTNGVRQGGILSPLLYSIYNDVLLNMLKEKGNGCYIGNKFYGALSYADDLCILSPTVSGLQSMLKTCEIYGIEYDVIFNPVKTQCVKFSRGNESNNSNLKVELCGKVLSWVKSVKYLGNWISSNLSENIEIGKKLGIFYGSVNNLNASFNNVGVNNASVLFAQYCCHDFYSQHDE